MCTPLQGRALPESEVLQMLRSASRPALWRYLHHVLSRSGPDPAGSAAAPQLNTELAVVLLEEALRLSPQLAAGASPPCTPQSPAAGAPASGL